MDSVRYQRYLGFAVMVYIVFFSTYSLLRHYSYLSSGYDLGIFMQSLWTIAHGEGFFFNTGEWEDIGTFSHFGVHNSPILIPLVPLYKMFPYAETLLILQTIALGFGALALFKFAKTLIGERTAFYLSLMYLSNPLIHGINRFDFHPVSLVVPLIFLIPYYYEKREYAKMVFIASIVLTAKEDAGLILISLGWFFIVRKYGLKNSLNIKHIFKNFNDLKWEMTLGFLGAMWILLSIFVVIPHFNGGYYPYFDGTKLHRYTLTGIHVDYVIAFTFITLGSIAFMPLLNLEYATTSLPLWLELVPSKKPEMLIIGYQYPYMLVPFLFIISVYNLKNLMSIKLIIETRLKKEAIVLTIRKALAISVVAMILFSPVFHIIKGPYIQGITFYNLVKIKKEWEPYFSVLDNVTEAISLSPCPVSTQDNLFPHLADRNNTYYLLTPFHSSYIPNNSIVLLARSLPDYKVTVKALRNSTLTANKTYFVLDVNTIILDCYNRTENNTEEFKACIMNYTKRIIQECEQARLHAGKK